MLKKIALLIPILSVASFGGTITNGTFETGDLTGWTITATNPTPAVTATIPHSGSYALLLGTDAGTEPLGDGAIYQQISGILAGDSVSFFYRTFTQDSLTFDWQDAYIQDSSGTIIQTLFHEASNHPYQQVLVDLTPYAGQTIRLAFLVHQDGFGDDTSMRIDDVSTGVPEPYSLGLAGLGLAALGIGALRRRKA